MTALTPQAFVAKWRHVELKERSACQEHFNDLGDDETLCVARLLALNLEQTGK
ncbi:hypothetical protein TFLX_04144 [Thermoflexales bacterium]|nr:hypothetical protein TFLX_04144 [Thermoflexales bacterium]